MANKKKQAVVENTEETVATVRKTKIDYIPEDMIDEFNALQAALASRKSGGKRDYSKLSQEEIQARIEKQQKKLAALTAALGM